MAAYTSGSIVIIACLSKVAMDQSPVFGLAFILGRTRQSHPDAGSTTGARCSDIRNVLTITYRVAC